MASKKPSLWGYIKEAFKLGPRVPGLGRMPLNALALVAVGVAGVVFSPAILAVGAGAELGYLMWMAHNPRFRRLVDAKHRFADKSAEHEQRLRLLAKLPAGDKRRLYGLEQRCREVADTGKDGGHGLGELRLQSLNKLSWIFLRLLVSRQLVQEKVAEQSRSDIETKLEETEKRLTSEEAGDLESPLRRTLESTMDLLRRRLDNLDRAAERIAYCDSELERIEQQVALLVEEAALAKDADGLGSRVDAVASTLDDTQMWMADQAAMMDGIDIETTPDIITAPSQELADG